jgi:hypothetical protein
MYIYIYTYVYIHMYIYIYIYIYIYVCIQYGRGDEEKTKYFILEALPKIVRAVLKRKYSTNEEHTVAAKDFLLEAASFAATLLSKYGNSLMKQVYIHMYIYIYIFL